MSALGVYLPGDSPLHRAPAGAKLLGLTLAEAGAVLLPGPWSVGAALAVVAGLYAFARVPFRVAWAQTRPILLIALLVGGFQMFGAGVDRALVVAGQLVLSVSLAGLVTLTTRSADLLDVIERGCRPLRFVGVDGARVALVLALAIRAVPVVAALTQEVREAQRARGVTGGLTAFAVPLLVRTLRYADNLGEALAARGVDD
ncbi:energy-coupling factor transporter transmembrane protein EcfT [Microtetraspora sp. NBRC 16547]|uniref:energy-coupling factor transporter transmembrane component T family protein n=1 Tax=Microtetraspora sp. NBRC 16547 TaxID=3030993 RepID=UPI0024A2023A|nr:energy-coupling factor transporter transmembrane protein EcfT [Microtetraspora sp. NBRC 16547]GLW98497.1 cobalt ABC transporter permease [Microtetraspora sp. NBRC 16547]